MQTLWKKVIAKMARDPSMRKKWLAFRGDTLIAVGTSYKDVKARINTEWKPEEILIRSVSPASTMHPLVAAYKPRRVRDRI